jgi:hypothetical protein
VTPLAEIVEVSSLLEAIWTSAAFGLGVLLVAGIGVSASLRAAEARGEHHEGGFASYSIVTVVCALLLVAAAALGIWAMTR